MKLHDFVAPNLLQFLLPGLEMALNSVVDQMNKVCAVVRVPGYEIVRAGAAQLLLAETEFSEAAKKRSGRPPGTRNKPKFPDLRVELPVYEGRRRVWTEEQKREAVRYHESLPRGTGGYNIGGRAPFLKHYNISSNMIDNWRKEFGAAPAPSVKLAKKQKKPFGTGAGATRAEILKWARAHDNIFSVDAFHVAHPGIHLRGLGNAVVNGLLKKSGPKEFKLTAKGEAA